MCHQIYPSLESINRNYFLRRQLFWHLIFRHFDWISFICFWIHLIGLLIWPIRWFYVTTNWRNQSKQVSSTTASRSTKGLGHRCTQINLNVHYIRLHFIGRSLTSRISNGFCHFTVENSRNPAIGPLIWFKQTYISPFLGFYGFLKDIKGNCKLLYIA